MTAIIDMLAIVLVVSSSVFCVASMALLAIEFIETIRRGPQ